MLKSFLSDTKAKKIADIGGGKIGYIRVLLELSGQLDLYLNIELSKFDIYDGIDRICSTGTQAAYDLFELSYFIDGPMQKKSTLVSIPKAMVGTFDTIISIFAFHHGCGNATDMIETIKLVSHLAAVGCNVMIVVYNFDKIRIEFDSPENPIKELDLGIVRFKPLNNWIFKTALSFQNYKYFEEPAPNLITLLKEMKKAGFTLTGTAEFNDMDIKALKYIVIFKFKKIN